MGVDLSSMSVCGRKCRTSSDTSEPMVFPGKSLPSRSPYEGGSKLHVGLLSRLHSPNKSGSKLHVGLRSRLPDLIWHLRTSIGPRGSGLVWLGLAWLRNPVTQNHISIIFLACYCIVFSEDIGWEVSWLENTHRTESGRLHCMFIEFHWIQWLSLVV